MYLWSFGQLPFRNIVSGDVEALAEAMFHREFESIWISFPKAGLAIDAGTEWSIVGVGCGAMVKDCADGER